MGTVDLGKLLVDFTRARGLTKPTRVAEVTKLTRESISRMGGGKVPWPKRKSFERFAAGLHMSEEELFVGLASLIGDKINRIELVADAYHHDMVPLPIRELAAAAKKDWVAAMALTSRAIQQVDREFLDNSKQPGESPLFFIASYKDSGINTHRLINDLRLSTSCLIPGWDTTGFDFPPQKFLSRLNNQHGRFVSHRKTLVGIRGTSLEFEPTFNEEKGVLTDYAIVAHAPSQRARTKGRSVFFVHGCHRIGTLAAAVTLGEKREFDGICKQALRNARAAGRSGIPRYFELVLRIRVTVRGGGMSSPEVVAQIPWVEEELEKLRRQILGDQ